jgi:hypothetical protein
MRISVITAMLPAPETDKSDFPEVRISGARVSEEARMNANQPDRMQQFDAELAALRIKGGSSATERLLIRLSALAMTVGLVAVCLANTTIVSDGYTTTTGLLGVGFTVVGGAVFLRYSLGQYLRYWLLRQIHEQRIQTDRLLGSGAAGTADGPDAHPDWPRVWPEAPTAATDPAPSA